MNSQGSHSDDLTRALVTLATLVDSEEGVDEAARRIAELAVHAINAADFAALSIQTNGSIENLCATHELAKAAETIQGETGQGPGLSSIKDHATFEITDMGRDETWPEFSRRVADLGIGSLLSFVLEIGPGAVGTLNAYKRAAGSFEDVDRATGAILAAHAAMILGAIQTAEERGRRARELEAGMVTRDLVGKAIGILMQRDRITADEAFDRLRVASQNLNRKLREIAEDLVSETETRAGTKEEPD